MRPTTRKAGRVLCAALLIGAGGTMRTSRAQVPPSFLQIRTGNALNVHELSLLANAPFGNLDAVEGALSRGADVNAQDADGRAALMLAASYNNHRGRQVGDEFKRRLAAARLSGNTGGGWGGSIYWHLSNETDLASEPARYLLQEGAVQRPDPVTGKPVLVWRATNGNGETLQTLLAHKADINLRDNGGRTALIYAARDDNPTALRLLLQNRADVNARDAAGMTALGYAARRGDADDVQALLASGARADARSADGPTLLRYAIGRHDSAQVRALLDQGAAANGQGFDAPLMVAVSSDNEEAALLLIERGVDVNAKTGVQGEWPPLAMAVEFSRHERMAQFLLLHGADPNGKSIFGGSVFLQASMTGSVPLLQTFVDTGADVNTRDTRGDTPLLQALLGFNHADAGVDVSAMSWRDREEAGTLAVVKLLTAKGANVNAANESGETPLLRAVQRGRLDTTRYLIERGANVNAKTDKGVTPLSWAIRFHENAVADILRAAGAKE